VNMNISNIYAMKDILIVAIQPTVSKTPGSKSKQPT